MISRLILALNLLLFTFCSAASAEELYPKLWDRYCQALDITYEYFISSDPITPKRLKADDRLKDVQVLEDGQFSFLVDGGWFDSVAERVQCVVGKSKGEVRLLKATDEETEAFITKVKAHALEEPHSLIGILFLKSKNDDWDDEYTFRQSRQEFEKFFIETVVTIQDDFSVNTLTTEFHRRDRETFISLFTQEDVRWSTQKANASKKEPFRATITMTGDRDNEDDIFGEHRLMVFKSRGKYWLNLYTHPAYWDAEQTEGLAGDRIESISGIRVNGEEMVPMEDIDNGTLQSDIDDFEFTLELDSYFRDRLRWGENAMFWVKTRNGEEYAVEFPLSGSGRSIEAVMRKKGGPSSKTPATRVAQTQGQSQSRNQADSKSEATALLFKAMDTVNYDLLEQSIAMGADTRSPIYKGMPPLEIAVRLKDPKMIRIIGKSPNLDLEHKNKDGDGYLHTAAHYFEGTEVLEALLDIGCRLDAKDNEGREPLSRAVCYQSFNKVKFLKDQGANLHATDNNGNTVLHHRAANSFTNLRVVEYLVTVGADTNARNHDGETPLMLALKNQSWEQIFFLAKNSDVSVKDYQGRTAEDLARYYHRCRDLKAEFPMLALVDSMQLARIRNGYGKYAQVFEKMSYYLLGFRETQGQSCMVKVKFKDEYGQWVTKGWFEIKPESKGLVAKSKYPEFYYYVVFKDGSFIGERSAVGNSAITVNGERRGGAKYRFNSDKKGVQIYLRL